MNGEWSAHDSFGREFRIREVMPPENLARASRCKVFRSTGFIFAGFIDANGRRLMQITDSRGSERWVLVIPQIQQPASIFVEFDFGGFGANTGTASWRG